MVWFTVLKKETNFDMAKRVVLEMINKFPFLSLSNITKAERDYKKFPAPTGRGVSDLRTTGDIIAEDSPEFLEEQKRRKQGQKELKKDPAWKRKLVASQKDLAVEQFKNILETGDSGDETVHIHITDMQELKDVWDDYIGDSRKFKPSSVPGVFTEIGHKGGIKRTPEAKEPNKYMVGINLKEAYMTLYNDVNIGKRHTKDYRDPTEKEIQDHFITLILHEIGHTTHLLADPQDFFSQKEKDELEEIWAEQIANPESATDEEIEYLEEEVLDVT